MSQIEDRLNELNLKPIRRSKMPATSGAFSIHEKLLFVGEVSGGEPGGEPNERTGREAGEKLAALACAAADGADEIEAALRVRVLVHRGEGEIDIARVADGVSDALVARLGARGRHTRTVFGATALDENRPVACDGVFLLRRKRHA